MKNFKTFEKKSIWQICQNLTIHTNNYFLWISITEEEASCMKISYPTLFQSTTSRLYLLLCAIRAKYNSNLSLIL